MDQVQKFDTMMSRTYQLEYVPSEDDNRYFKITEHKTRPYLHEVTERDQYRRTLAELLASRKVKGHLDKSHSSLNKLHKYEIMLQNKVSLAAPTKAHQNYAALRQGRDPRMNESNAYFDRQAAMRAA